MSSTGAGPVMQGALPILEGMAEELLGAIRKAKHRSETESLTDGQWRYQVSRIGRKSRDISSLMRRIGKAAASTAPPALQGVSTPSAARCAGGDSDDV